MYSAGRRRREFESAQNALREAIPLKEYIEALLKLDQDAYVVSGRTVYNGDDVFDSGLDIWEEPVKPKSYEVIEGVKIYTI